MTNNSSNERTPSPSPDRGKAIQAALLSALVIPGAGQMYNRQWLKGLAMLLLFLVCSLAVLIPISLAMVGYYLSIGSGNIDNATQTLQPLAEQWIHLLILAFSTIGIYVYSIVDAYRGRMRKKQGIRTLPMEDA